MGQAFSALKISNQSHKCDLSDEQVEEIRMETFLPVGEIYRMRKKFVEAVKNPNEMTKEEFFALPVMSTNPLKKRLYQMLELSQSMTIPFSEFINMMSILSYHSSRDAKLKYAFKIHDFDGDSKISRSDLLEYMQLVVDFGEKRPEETEEDALKRHNETMELVVSRIMEEASSDPSLEFLVYDDFVKVAQSTDFDTHLLIPF